MLLLAAVLAGATAASAQTPGRTPRLGYVYPAGGQQGTSFEVKVGGQFLDGAAKALVSGTGVEATVVEHIKPITPPQANKLKEQLRELVEKRAAAMRSGKKRGNPPEASDGKSGLSAPWTPDDEKLLADIRKKLSTFVRRPPNPAIAETVLLKVAVSPDAQTGLRELRLQTSLGLTNPLVFCVGQLPEVREEESKPVLPAKYTKKAKRVATTTAETEMPIPLPVVVNGQIMPGDVDRFRFTAKKGQRLVLAASARQLIPYLPDAVPGWFQATLAIYDASGREVAYADDDRFDPDPVLCYEVPADGQYVVEIKDAIYRGRDDFVYRITVGELPYLTGIFPLGGRAGQATTIELLGWNLPTARMTWNGSDNKEGVVALTVRQGPWLSNSVPFAVEALPECTEREPNDTPGAAQPVTLPTIVNGRISRPDDGDVFRIEGRAGGRIVAEVQARRLRSPLDSILRLTDAAGNELAANDDHEDKGAGLTTHHADSWLSATLPADGTYYLHLGDAQRHGGPEYGYRLRIGPPQPDFALRVVPSSISARSGAAVPITVYALRKDGFSGPIAIALKDAPAGFAISGGRIPAGQDQVRLTLSVPSAASDLPFCLRLEGRAVIDGRETVRPAVPAEDMMQAFAYRHLVPAQELRVAVAGRSVARSAIAILGQTPVKIPAGGTASIRVGVPINTPLGKIDLELSDPPEGIAIKQVSPAREGTAIVLATDAAKIKPGTQGNLIVLASVKRSTPCPVTAETMIGRRSGVCRSARLTRRPRPSASRRSTLFQTSIRRLSFAAMPSSSSTFSTSRDCAAASSCDMSRTWRMTSASITSSSVARNAATSMVGKSEMKPTVSESMTRLPCGRSTARNVGSSVANSMSADRTAADVIRLNSVDLPALV
jgi:hypothetical protein